MLAGPDPPQKAIQFIAIFAFLALFLGWPRQPLFWIGLIATAWCIHFFSKRSAARHAGLRLGSIVSSADGRGQVEVAAPAPPPPELELEGRRRGCASSVSR